MSSPERNLRDQLREMVPWWLSDRKYTSGKTVGFRYLWVFVALLDAFIEYAVQGLLASLPGVGTYSALPYIGRSRGIIRGRLDTDASYARKLRAWLEKWATAASATRLAIELQEYLGTTPRIRVFSRHGQVVTLNSDGTIERTTCAWDWDSVSHPERAGYWSELWIVVYGSTFPQTSGTWGDGSVFGDGADGFGHEVTRTEYAAARGLVAQWKGAHEFVRTIIWTSDDTLFNPATPASLPNGNWGEFWVTVGGNNVPSGRNLTTCRYWDL